MHTVDPLPWQTSKVGEVLVGGKEFGLEAPYSMCRTSSLGHGATADNPVYHRITTQAVRVVHAPRRPTPIVNRISALPNSISFIESVEIAIGLHAF